MLLIPFQAFCCIDEFKWMEPWVGEYAYLFRDEDDHLFLHFKNHLYDIKEIDHSEDCFCTCIDYSESES